MRPLLTLLGMQEPAHIKAPSGIVGHVIHLHLPEVDGCGRHRNHRRRRNDPAATASSCGLSKSLGIGSGVQATQEALSGVSGTQQRGWSLFIPRAVA